MRSNYTKRFTSFFNGTINVVYSDSRSRDAEGQPFPGKIKQSFPISWTIFSPRIRASFVIFKNVIYPETRLQFSSIVDRLYFYIYLFHIQLIRGSHCRLNDCHSNEGRASRQSLHWLQWMQLQCVFTQEFSLGGIIIAEWNDQRDASEVSMAWLILKDNNFLVIWNSTSVIIYISS